VSGVERKGCDKRQNKGVFLFMLLLGLQMLQINSCAPNQNAEQSKIYMYRGYFLNSGHPSGENLPIRQPFLDWARDPEDQFRTIRPPTNDAERVGTIRQFSQFRDKIKDNIHALAPSKAVAVKVVAPDNVITELLPILQGTREGGLEFKVSTCDGCNQKPDIIIVALCAYGKVPCFGAFSYDQYGVSGLKTGEIKDGVRVIRGSNTHFPKVDNFCPDGNLISMGGPIDFGKSRIEWFEFPEEMSMQLLAGFSTFEAQPGENDWNDAMSEMRIQVNGNGDPLVRQLSGAYLLSVLEGQNFDCRKKNRPANVERFMTFAVPSVEQLSHPRVCIVSGHEPTPKAQAKLIARCARFSGDPMSEITQLH
jgi:hypothetical protein